MNHGVSLTMSRVNSGANNTAVTESFVFPTYQDSSSSSKRLDPTSPILPLKLGSEDHHGVKCIQNTEHDYPPLNQMPFLRNSSRYTDQDFSFNALPSQPVTRVTNPNRTSPLPIPNHLSGSSFGPFLDTNYGSSTSLLSLPGTGLARHILGPSSRHRRARSSISSGSTSPTRTRYARGHKARNTSKSEQFVSYDAFKTDSRLQQHTSDLDPSIHHQQALRSTLAPLADPKLSTSKPSTVLPFFQTQDEGDPFTSEGGQQDQSMFLTPMSRPLGSSGYCYLDSVGPVEVQFADPAKAQMFFDQPNVLGRMAQSLETSDYCHFDTIGLIEVRFANPVKAQMFFDHFHASRLDSATPPRHDSEIVRQLTAFPEIDYTDTSHFYPRQLPIDSSKDPPNEHYEFSEPPEEVERPDSSVLSFQNGQPGRLLDLQSFLNAHPMLTIDSEESDWSYTIKRSMYRPNVFFHVPENKPKYPDATSEGLVFVRYMYQPRDDRAPMERVAFLPFVRDWYRQSETIVLGEDPSLNMPQLYIHIRPTRVAFGVMIPPAERPASDELMYFEVPNVPSTWIVIEQLLLCACHPFLPFPALVTIKEVLLAGFRRHMSSIKDHPFVQRIPEDMLEGLIAHHAQCDYHPFFIDPNVIDEFVYPAEMAKKLLEFHLVPAEAQYFTDNIGNRVAAFERNISFVQFLKQWLIRYRLSAVPGALEPLPEPYHEIEFPPILEAAAHAGTWDRPEEIEQHDVNTETNDFQGINWRSLGIFRKDARKLRDSLYIPYYNLKEYTTNTFAKTLPDTDHFFRFRRTQCNFRPCLEHFQLRNLMSAVDKNCIAWIGEYRVNLTDPNTGVTNEAIRLISNSENDLSACIRLSTMKAGHGVVVAGGYEGEYAFNGIGQPYSSQVTGLLTVDKESITNHVELFLNRSNASPCALFAQNDKVMRLFDLQTNKPVSTQKLSEKFAINCTATCPDGRLRLLVGDTPDAYVVDAYTGVPVIEPLTGHQDYGFACAWSPCGRQIATGNQDGMIQIFDTRMWRRLAVIEADVAGYRSLAFSPPGGGQRVLLAAEPADRISIIDAQTFETRQVHDFFGEIGGADFLPDGSNIVIANLDKKVGGLMWYERDSFGAERGLSSHRRVGTQDEDDEFDPVMYREEEAFEFEARYGVDKGVAKGKGKSLRGVEVQEWVGL